MYSRKRAKTEDEKEQRRVERVLRNRRAAQSSRERKRLETEALEKKNQDLADQLDQANRMIAELLQRLGPSGASSSFDALRPQNPITFSQELFNSKDGHMAPQAPHAASALMDGIVMTSKSSNTVNPASLSPTLCPVPEEDDEEWLAENKSSTQAAPVAEAHATSEETSPDSTQLPAAELCSIDLQCRSAEVPPRSWLTASQHRPLWLYLTLFSHFQLQAQKSLISACRQPLLQVAMSMRAGSSLLPTPAILNSIIWLVTTRRHSSPADPASTTSTSTSSSPKTSTSPPSASANSSSTASTTAPPPATHSRTLRLKTLLRILSCSPHLARPLRIATLEVLRLVVSKKMTGVDGVLGHEWSTTGTDGGSPSPQPRQQQEEGMEYLKHVPHSYTGGLPSVEVLFTLAWFCQLAEANRLKLARHVSAERAFEAAMREQKTKTDLVNVSMEEAATAVVSQLDLGSKVTQENLRGSWELEHGTEVQP